MKRLLLALVPNMILMPAAKLALAQSGSLAAVAVQSIPTGKVLTPVGLLDETCVFEIPDGAEFSAVTGDVKVNGTVVAHHAWCAPAEQSQRAGQTDTTDPVRPPAISRAWVDWCNANATAGGGLLGYYNRTYSQWQVPNDPPSEWISNKTLYFFPSIQSGDEILQPVLQWGHNGSFGLVNGWCIASWYCHNSSCAHSTPRSDVHQGDWLEGQVNMTSNNPMRYEVYTNDMTRSHSTVTSFTTQGDSFGSVQSGAMEVYNISSCSQYPTSDPLTIYTNVYQAGPTWDTYNSVVPTWGTYVTPNLNPSCQYGAVASTEGITSLCNLQYHNQ